jgi:hypothetical protein
MFMQNSGALRGEIAKLRAAPPAVITRVPTIPKFRYEIEEGGLASLSPPCNVL